MLSNPNNNNSKPTRKISFENFIFSSLALRRFNLLAVWFENLFHRMPNIEAMHRKLVVLYAKLFM